MTRDASFKKVVRRHAGETGQRYTEAQYDRLPGQARTLIEVNDGNVIFCPSGAPEHGDVTRALAIRLDGR